MIAKTSYDQIYDEHVFMFSATSVKRAFAAHGLDLVDVVPQITHGGSMRYVTGPKRQPNGFAARRRTVGERAGAGARPARNLSAFQAQMRDVARALMQLLEDLRSAGQARGRLWRHLEEHDCHELLRHHARAFRIHLRHDADQAGQAVARRRTSRCRPYEEFARNYPDCALLFAWNHAAEIREKEQAFIADGRPMDRLLSRSEDHVLT